MNLQERSLQKELLDAADIPFEDIKKNMQELDTVNRLLGGHQITLQGLQAIMGASTKKIKICEIGCGGGDNLRAVYEYCKRKNIAVELTGIDIKKECIDYAVERNAGLPARWICSDYRLADLSSIAPDIVFSSLFCHHFTKEELIKMMGWMKENCQAGFFVNDLQRHSLAYYSIKWLTRLFSKSYLVKNDAPLSVARGFVKKEWQEIFSQAGIPDFSINWKWAFRYLIVYTK
ncbi:MAG: methyltransferase domain-containing protein [Gloeobacteraceae cyanobacterium ES-bin-316]|nr:methyltransferase domain-containing protein [Ferruginibacter sp.]